MANQVVHFEIAGKDGAKTRDFYARLFGWEFQLWGEQDYGMVSASGEGAIGGGVFGAPDGAPPYVTFYVHVDDLAASLAQAEQLGGKTCMPPTPIPGMGSMAMFTDPDGNMIGLFSSAQMEG